MDISFGNFNIFPSKNDGKIPAASSRYPNLAPLKKDTVSFSGKVRSKKEMSDSEFEELKKYIQNKVDNIELGEKQKENLSNLSLSKENIRAAARLIDNTELLNNRRYASFTHIMSRISNTEELAEARAMLIEKVFSSSKIYKNEDFFVSFLELMRGTDSIEKAEAQCQIIDKFLSYDGLVDPENDDMMDSFSIALLSTDTKEHADLRCRLLDRVMQDDIYSNNPDFLENLGMLLEGLYNERQYNGLCILLDKVKEHEELYTNDKFMNSLPHVAGRIINEESAQARCILIDEFMSKDELKNDPEFVSKFYDMLRDTPSENVAKANSALLDLWARNKDIIKNEKMNDFALRNGRYLGGDADENLSFAMDKILRINPLFDNEELHEKIKVIFPGLAEKCPEITSFVFEKLYENEAVQNNPALLKCFLDSFYETVFITSNDVPANMEEAQSRFKFLDAMIHQKNIPDSEEFYMELSKLTRFTNTDVIANSRIKVLEALTDNKKLFKNKNFGDNFLKILYTVNDEKDAAIKKYTIENLPKTEEFYQNDEVMSLLSNAIGAVKTKEDADNLVQLLNDETLSVNQIAILLDKENGVSLQQIQRLQAIMGRQRVEKLCNKDIIVAAKFADVYKKQNLNEISQAGKKEFLKGLVSCNTGMFEISDTLKESFPLIPTDQKEYCSLLPSIVRSLGIETKELSDGDIATFNDSCAALSDKLHLLSDAQFNALEITQDYSKDEFVQDVAEIVKNLSKVERNKVFDYFGFELQEKDGLSEEKFYLTGYPQNLNNGKKLAQIKDPATKEVVEKLRPYVIKFSENNHINCPQNKEIENFLNSIADILPEMRTMIGKKQHVTQSFDVLKHSLKVMQKISQTNEFNNLNDSDKKLMYMAALLHDITKQEGAVDSQHALNGSFDSYFICKKFNLTKDEEIKLYTLLKNHEWLKDVNIKDEAKRERKLQHTAYDFRHDNIFDMALMFTHADLRSVYDNNLFHDKKEGKGRISIDGVQRSFGECADIYGEKIKGYIEELKKSQPLLPVTKLPTADTINKAITVVHPDGSTNIKGVYKDKDGLIVLKYNEIEDFETIGFEKGSTNRGYVNDSDENDKFNTGNIKFFVHGLDYENQLTKFDAFSLIDSDALLSVSYAERPESKYRFFRPQGVLLDVDTKYIHGGGETDAGSGCGKSIQEFKNNYIFGGYRENDRLFVSQLIKEALGLNDSEYIDFVKKNENKSIAEIEPKEAREKLILAFGTINSKTRHGQRNYNEMYASNPKKPMGVFTYSVDDNEKIGNPIDFLNRREITRDELENFRGDSPISVYDRTEFLRRYAVERNIPMVVFGD